MTTISSVGNSAALAILRSGSRAGVSAVDFLLSSVFKASSDAVAAAIFNAIAGNSDFQKEFLDSYDAAMKRGATLGGIHPDNAKHIALADLIIKHRQSFPPEEFTIHTDLPDGASITTTIPSVAAMKGEIFKEQIAEKQAAFDAEIAAAKVSPDPAAVKLNALSQVVKVLVLDGAEPVSALLENSQPKPDELAKPFAA
ncbi:hypothetical protein [Sinorhizobium terangae]|uniref:Uncharacterized protein n=1 Tax=Sinorhizobium terangae TaxID=110322 RepID=A0A6N7LI25_SINTE|nr:hypothetical protein [Sinorhizobium terangae]MBB4185347.1 hypothetical protein [Sinorhizobium terangae]MQX17417.1 hypothetical protein [Sinorhizobium terangae]WFU46575.1 hypothetical protein QA637_11765 [Sinorhizobium terangae]